MMKKNVLSGKQFLALSHYIEAHKDRILAERPTQGALAAQAATELGFTISTGNVKNVLKACEIAWVAKPNSVRQQSPRGSYWKILAAGLLEIAGALDIKLDPNVYNIVHGRALVEVEKENA